MEYRPNVILFVDRRRLPPNLRGRPPRTISGCWFLLMGLALVWATLAYLGWEWFQ